MQQIEQQQNKLNSQGDGNMKRLTEIVFSCICSAAGYAGAENIPKFIGISRIERMSEENLSRALRGARREQLVDVWGEPDYHLSGLFGDIFSFGGGRKSLCRQICHHRL